jgi:hypothetical protein
MYTGVGHKSLFAAVDCRGVYLQAGTGKSCCLFRCAVLLLVLCTTGQ